MSLQPEKIANEEKRLQSGLFSSISDAELFTQILALETREEEPPDPPHG